MHPSVSTFSFGHGTHFNNCMPKSDVNDLLHSSNRDIQAIGVGARELSKGGKALSIKNNSRNKGISLFEIIFFPLIIAELITKMFEFFPMVQIFHQKEFPKATVFTSL